MNDLPQEVPPASGLDRDAQHLEAAPTADLPAWSSLLVLVPAAVVAVVVLVGLLLAFVGQFRAWLTLLLAVPSGCALAFVAVRAGEVSATDGPRPVSRSASRTAVAAVISAGVLALAMGWAPAQHVVQDRDPGSYVSTAVWLGQNGNLEGDVRQGGVEALRADEYAVEFAGVYEVGSGRVQFQFNHGTSVVLATAKWAGGNPLLFRASALLVALGMLALFGVAAAALGRPWVGLVVAVGTAVSLPWWFVARDAYSEPAALLMYWSALLLLVTVLRRPSVPAGLLVGLFFGACLAVRIDTALLIAPVVVVTGAFVGAAAPAARPQLRRASLSGLVALVLGLGVSLADLAWRSGGYVNDLRPLVLVAVASLVVAIACSWTLAVVVPRAPHVVERVCRWAAWASWPAATALVLLLLFMWLLRPHLGADRATLNAGVESLQRLLRLEPDGTRTYAEQSLRWMSWYLGPVVLAAAVLGAGAAVRRVLSGVAGRALVLVAVPGLLVALIYLYDPKITPDQPWAMRRFAPSVVPTLFVLAGLVVVELWGSGTSLMKVRRLAAALVSVLIVVGPAIRTWPVRLMAPQRSYLDAVEQVCRTVGPDATVVVAGAVESIAMQQTFRSWCDVPVVAATDKFGPGAAQRLVDAAAERGRRVWVVSFDPSAAARLGAQPDGPPAVVESAGDLRAPRQELLGPPTRYDSRDPVLKYGSGSEDGDTPRFRLFLQPLGAVAAR